MSELQGSFTGTVRIILILLGVWWVLRFIMRMQQAKGGNGGQRHSDNAQRPKGEVRVENIPQRDSKTPSGGSVSDADYEEIE